MTPHASHIHYARVLLKEVRSRRHQRQFALKLLSFASVSIKAAMKQQRDMFGGGV